MTRSVELIAFKRMAYLNCIRVEIKEQSFNYRKDDWFFHKDFVFCFIGPWLHDSFLDLVV